MTETIFLINLLDSDPPPLASQIILPLPNIVAYTCQNFTRSGGERETQTAPLRQG